MPNSSYRYRVVDVFTQEPLQGNPLAVFPNGSGLSDDTMQKIARELNLSVTVFVFQAKRADCAVSLRIFTPAREMIFAGHPTVGTSFVLLDEGLVPKGTEQFAVEENIGRVPIRVEAGESPLIWLSTPPIHFGETFPIDVAARVLGLTREDLIGVPPQLVSAGNPTIAIALKNKQAVDRAWLEVAGLNELRGAYPDPACVFVFAPTAEGAYSRMFAPEYGIAEDPATGSSTGPVAAYMMQHNLVSHAAGTRFVSEQGAKMGRKSMLHVLIRGERGSEGIDVGGYVTPLVEATMRL